MTSPNPQHMVPIDEGDHTYTPDCPCKPFGYAVVVDGQVHHYEFRHNSFDALPVDEELLEKVQRSQPARDDDPARSE